MDKNTQNILENLRDSFDKLFQKYSQLKSAQLKEPCCSIRISKEF